MNGASVLDGTEIMPLTNKISGEAGLVAQQVELTSHIGANASPGCSTSNSVLC